MSFKTNSCQQISLEDSFLNLTAQEKKALENSWAQVFADEIFPAIDEERFSVLYSGKGSRPNTPVSVIIGALIIKVLADFTFREDGTRLITCAAGYEPVSQSFTKSTRQIRASFDRSHCVNCPHKDQCHPKIHKKVASLVTSKNASNRAKSQRYMKSGEFSNYAKLRNGVETVPANIRRNYHLEKLPRGKQRGKFFFGSKIAALNFRKLFGYRKGLGNYAKNPVLA